MKFVKQSISVMYELCGNAFFIFIATIYATEGLLLHMQSHDPDFFVY